jgi:hypothetical protein
MAARYDPLIAPDPAHWLSLSEDERTELVLKHHRRAKTKLPKARMHAAMHVMVENQLAEGYPAVVEALDRLIAGGLHRHAALHAIASVAIVQLHAVMQGSREFDRAAYDRELRALTVETWLKGLG